MENGKAPPEFGSAEMRAQFPLDAEYVATNHGSFGVTPLAVTAARIGWAERIERNPDLFLKVDYDSALDAALIPAARLLGLHNATISNISDNDLLSVVFTVNASTAINAVLRSLKAILAASARPPPSPATHKILCLSTVYGNVRKAIAYTGLNDAFGVVELRVDFSRGIPSDISLVAQVSAAIDAERQAGADVVLFVFDVVSSSPAIVSPFAKLTRLCRAKNILSCIDAAHAIGQIPVDLKSLQPDFFVTNLHKWLFVPRGCCLFYVDPRFHGVINHPVISETHFGNWRRGFHWVGTTDVSAFLTVSAALEFREWIGGENSIIKYNHDLAVRAGQIVAKKLETRVLRGVIENDNSSKNLDSQYASMVNVAVPNTQIVQKGGDLFMEGLQKRLLTEYNASVAFFKIDDEYWIRLSAQVYLNDLDFEKIADILYAVFHFE
ncbi:hypothetical protein HK100_004118 [Physocladia obscura]|uniref:Aminotransferase class V domain-containing protein n=1 Tax=Physocladia obscura TaxID=109957 RepID=A0AAD5SW58_9FUNG|nr:hypothetical protein HK100_004118 [Physocladia obscura]